MKPDAGTLSWLGRPCGAGNPLGLAYMRLWAELATVTQAFPGQQPCSSSQLKFSVLYDPRGEGHRNIENWNVPGSGNLSGVLLIKRGVLQMTWQPLATNAVQSQLQRVNVQPLRAAPGRSSSGAQSGAVLKGFLMEEALGPGFLKPGSHPP